MIDDGCTTFQRPADVATGTFTISGNPPAHVCSTQSATALSFLLADLTTWVIRDNELIVYGGGSQAFALVYRSSTSTRPQHDWTPLRAHPWQAPMPDPAVVTFTRTGYSIAHTCYYRIASMQVSGATIAFGSGRSVPHSCPAPAKGSGRDQAAAHLDAIFSGQVRWAIVDGQLALSGNKGTVLLQPPGAEQSSLTSSAWHLTSTTTDGQTRPAVGDVVLTFPTPQSLLLKRCYQSGTPVTVQSTTLTVRFLRTTLARPCPSGPPGTQEQNAALDSVLSGTVTWVIDGNRLTLSKGAGSLVFTRRP